jgi:quinol monooxygenase YgiN
MAIRSDLSTAYPGLKFARVFQHLTEPDDFLAFEEWETQAEYQRAREAPGWLESLAGYGPPPHADRLERLQMYRHLLHRPVALACVSLTTPLDRADAVEELICGDAQREVLVGAGLVIRAVYRVIGEPGRLLVLHGWRSVAHLEQFQQTVAEEILDALAAHGTVIEPFVGALAAEFSWLEH